MAIPFWRRRADKPIEVRDPLDDRDDLDEETKERIRWMRSLGIHRHGVLLCLGADRPRSAFPIQPDPNIDPLESFARYIQGVEQRSRHWTDPVHRSVAAAGRLLIGKLDAADTILDMIPEVAYERDHGSGKCLVLPQQTLAGVLPLPPALTGSSDRWIAASPEVAAIRSWLAEHRARLRWCEIEGTYVLDPAPR